ncbi:hypothetical protein Tco_0291765 [Tanacetum coccineum]
MQNVNNNVGEFIGLSKSSIEIVQGLRWSGVRRWRGGCWVKPWCDDDDEVAEVHGMAAADGGLRCHGGGDEDESGGVDGGWLSWRGRWPESGRMEEGAPEKLERRGRGY